MNTGRRFFLTGIAGILAGMKTVPAGGQGQRRESPAHIPGIPDASNSNGAGDTPLPPRADPKIALKEDQKTLRRDVGRLLQMVKDLKEESDSTPETDVLSLSLVKKAEDIEKLARQIKERIRAS